jgi:hypothetical protein
MRSTSNVQYRVLSPWADADPVPLRGISPRLASLEGKKIGIFRNFKQAAKPYAAVMAQKLRERYITSQISIYESNGANALETETENEAKFKHWVEGIDAGISLFGN